jgi:hypothetical protein
MCRRNRSPHAGPCKYRLATSSGAVGTPVGNWLRDRCGVRPAAVERRSLSRAFRHHARRTTAPVATFARRDDLGWTEKAPGAAGHGRVVRYRRASACARCRGPVRPTMSVERSHDAATARAATRTGLSTPAPDRRLHRSPASLLAVANARRARCGIALWRSSWGGPGHASAHRSRHSVHRRPLGSFVHGDSRMRARTGTDSALRQTQPAARSGARHCRFERGMATGRAAARPGLTTGRVAQNLSHGGWPAVPMDLGPICCKCHELPISPTSGFDPTQFLFPVWPTTNPA